MYATSGDRGSVGTQPQTESLARSSTSSKPGDGLLAFANNVSVTMVNPTGSQPSFHHGDRPALHDLQSHGTRASPRLKDGLGDLPHH